MKLVLCLILLSLGLFGQAPQPQPPVSFPQVNRKARVLTPDEVKTIQRLNEEFELLARRACESIGVLYSDCQIGDGNVSEKPKPPQVVPQSAQPKPEAAKPEAKPEAKPPAK